MGETGPRVYRIHLFKTWPGVCLALGLTVGSWVIYQTGQLFIKSTTVHWSLALCWWLMVIALLCFFGVVTISSLMTVTTTDNGLAIRRPDTAFQVRWNEIKRIESVWTIYGGNFEYQLVTVDGRRLPAIPDYIEGCDELLKTIQQRSGKRIVSEYRTIGKSVREDWRNLLKFLRLSKRR